MATIPLDHPTVEIVEASLRELSTYEDEWGIKLGRAEPPRIGLATVKHRPHVPAATICQHNRVREIGQDFDKDGRLLRLERCQRCGLLMREYLPSL